MEFKNMIESELAEVMVNYINRVGHLKNIIARYIDGSDNGNIPAYRIRMEYKQLKEELRADAHYLDLARNRNDNYLYMHVFAPSIREASACGFTVPSNSLINYAMFSAVSDAYYKLTKHYSLEQWEDLM